MTYRWTFLASILCALLAGILWAGSILALYPLLGICGRDPSLPYLEYVPRQPFRAVFFITGILLAGMVVKNLLLAAQTTLVARLAYLGCFRFQTRLFARTLRIAALHDPRERDLTRYFTRDMPDLTRGLIALFGTLMGESIKILICVIGAGIVCWRLLLLTLFVGPAVALLVHGRARWLKRANYRGGKEIAEYYGTLSEAIEGARIVKTSVMERHERRRFYQNGKKYLRKAIRIVGYDGLSRSTIDVMRMLTVFLAVLAGAFLAFDHQTHLLGIRLSAEPLSLEWLAVFFGLLAGAVYSARAFADGFAYLQAGALAADRICEILDREPRIESQPNDLKQSA